MKNEFDILRKARELVIKELEGLSLDDIHKIPDGFKNNIAWNVAHLVVTQQLIHYGLSGLPMLVSDELIAENRKGTAPTRNFTAEEFEEVKRLLVSLPEKLVEDYEAGIFKAYKTYPTSTGYVLTSIENAIPFNNIHEGMHYGIIRSIKKML
ncbi:MAG: damage-inducible protein DinB [Flavobacteriaceae bacterium]|nr:damage-inducible protein DinB [Flavobacteriaceae bacterium]